MLQTIASLCIHQGATRGVESVGAFLKIHIFFIMTYTTVGRNWLSRTDTHRAASQKGRSQLAGIPQRWSRWWGYPREARALRPGAEYTHLAQESVEMEVDPAGKESSSRPSCCFTLSGWISGSAMTTRVWMSQNVESLSNFLPFSAAWSLWHQERSRLSFSKRLIKSSLWIKVNWFGTINSLKIPSQQHLDLHVIK